MFISDENKEIVKDGIENRSNCSAATAICDCTRIVEGFFIDSAKSRPLQLCDVCALCVRKKRKKKSASSSSRSTNRRFR